MTIQRAKDFYKILGLERNCTQDQIKNRFRKLATEYHPDAGGDAEKFKEISEAYSILSDPKTRAQYDKYGSTKPNIDTDHAALSGLFNKFMTI